jgi:hypothetical protein
VQVFFCEREFGAFATSNTELKDVAFANDFKTTAHYCAVVKAVAVPIVTQVGVGVEMDYAKVGVLFMHRLYRAKGNKVLAPKHQWKLAHIKDLFGLRLDRIDHWRGVGGLDFYVASIVNTYITKVAVDVGTVRFYAVGFGANCDWCMARAFAICRSRIVWHTEKHDVCHVEICVAAYEFFHSTFSKTSST